MEEIDVVLNPNDYSTMPKYQLQELALAGDKKAERIYFERYYGTNKNADIEKGNPNRDDRGRFTFGSGGSQAGGGGGAGGGEGGESASGGSGGSGDGVGEGKDITSELGAEYGTTSETKRGAELSARDMAPDQRGDATLEDIAKKQGFDGEADFVDQAEFDKIVADGGKVTYRGITDYHDGPGPDANYIQGETAITNEFAKGEYFAGNGVYGNGIYTSEDTSVANGFASMDGDPGSVVTMVVKPNARIATPEQWENARLLAKERKGGFMGANNEGRILAAQGFDGFDIAPNKDKEHWASDTIVILNRKAVAVLKK